MNEPEPRLITKVDLYAISLDLWPLPHCTFTVEDEFGEPDCA